MAVSLLIFAFVSWRLLPTSEATRSVFPLLLPLSRHQTHFWCRMQREAAEWALNYCSLLLSTAEATIPNESKSARRRVSLWWPGHSGTFYSQLAGSVFSPALGSPKSKTFPVIGNANRHHVKKMEWWCWQVALEVCTEELDIWQYCCELLKY